MFSIIIPAYNAEKYLSNTLESLINQSYQNFEVIIVNDGSADSTQAVIDSYCQKYSNFKSISQKNQGVAAARNNGIEVAKGDYIGFLDSDGDTYTKDALKQYNNTIINSDFPDMVIGRQTMIDMWSFRHYVNAKKLSNSKTIKPHDKRIMWTMSLLNKVFSRKKIMETGLKMPLLSYASDGAFVLPFAYSCDNIVGCPHEVLIYNKRTFFDEYSISQTSTMKTLNDYLEVHRIIHDKFLEYSEKYRETHSNDKKKLLEFEKRYLIYLDALLHRQVSIIISQFYRFFWRTDSDVLEKVKEIILDYKTKMLPNSWKRLKKSNKDLNLEDLILEKEDMVKKIHVSIAIDGNIKGKSLTQMLYNIHNFKFPNFEVFITQSAFESLPQFFKEKEYIKPLNSNENISFKNEFIKNLNGDFLLYLDEAVLMSLDLLKTFFDKVYNSNFDFILVRSRELNLYYFKSSKTFSKMLIRTEFLRRINFEFTDDIVKDIETIYSCGKHQSINKNLILNASQNFDQFVSLIIDDIEISSGELNNLIESIYNQNLGLFNTSNIFEIILNENLKSKVSKKHLSRDKLNIIKNENFKKLAIKNSKSKYALFVDVPVIYEESAFKELLLKIQNTELDFEDEQIISFVSTPIYQFNETEEKFDYFSSQKTSYFYQNAPIPSQKSKFLVFDLYLANKIIDLEYLRKNNIYFDNCNEDILKIYRTSKSVRVYKELISTKSPQNNLFKSSFKNKDVPISINIFYKFNKIFLIFLGIKEALRNGARK